MDRTHMGWFADIDEGAPAPFAWQAFLQDASGCSPLPIWFPSKSACEDYIKDTIIGLGMLP